MIRTIASTFVFLLLAGCSDNNSDAPPAGSSAPLTYYDDVAPILQDHCLQCHQDGGIAPFRLDDFATAKAHAAEMAADTGARIMPPWLVTSDGTCGNFSGSLALSDQEIQTISKWVKGGANEG